MPFVARNTKPLSHPSPVPNYVAVRNSKPMTFAMPRNVDLVRWTILISILLLSWMTFSNLKHFQKNLEDVLLSSDVIFFHLDETSPQSDRTNSQPRNEQQLFETGKPADSPQQSPSSTPQNQSSSSNARIVNNKSERNLLINNTIRNGLLISHNRLRTFQLNNQPPIDDGLECIFHKPIKIIVTESKRVSNPNKTVLEHTRNASSNCGQLRRDWRYNPPVSRFAQMLEEHQTNCTLPVATHYMDNTFGLGSHLLLWNQALCNVHEQQYRIRSSVNDVLLNDDDNEQTNATKPPPWIWMDQQHCDINIATNQSPLLCYFPNSESRCSDKVSENTSAIASSLQKAHIAPDPRVRKDWCQLVQESDEIRAEYRAASTEYLFQSVSPIVIQEAKRQIGIIFASTGNIVPTDLITVHIRWGDKFWEMDLPPIIEYIDGIKSLLPHNDSDANIYLATEDPRAYQDFLEAKPSNWNVYGDITLHEINDFRPIKGNRASWATKNTKGRAGLVALGSLLVAMEANRFVLTTKSNWSALMNHLRTSIVDPNCNHCTHMIDLRPGLW